MTILAEALKKAQEGDINSFSWKLNNGQEIRMMDMSEQELQRAFNHAWSMLYNESTWNPGKVAIKKRIKDTYDNCNAELFLRFVLHDCDIESIKTNKDLLEFVNIKRKQDNIDITDNITSMFMGAPIEFEKVTIDKLMSACFDKLDILNRKMISDKFILSQGIWLTGEEKQELTEYDEKGKLRDRLEIIKERLILNPTVQLRINTKGFNYAEFRALVKIEDNNPKLSSLPTFTLKVLRDKVLLLLDNDLDYHIEKWNKLVEQIKKVAEYKRIELKCVN